MKENSFDIIVVGGGMVGLAFADLMAQQSLKIAVVEVREPELSWSESAYGLRVSAVNLASQKLLEKIGVWSQLQRVSPYLTMQVWDENSDAAIHFDHKEAKQPYLGHIIENRTIIKALYEKLQSLDNVSLFCPATPKALQIEDNEIILQLENSHSLSGKLIIGADGAHSWLRDKVGIEINTRPYGHQAIVTVVHTEKSHQQTAWQRFLSTGPLAFLPFKDQHYCSIVWSAQTSFAEKLMGMQDQEFNQAITAAFEAKLGNAEVIDKRVSFPLHMRHAKQYVQPRVAFIGDAVRTIHPLAGQGVNLGFRDVVALDEVVARTANKGRDIGSYANLRPYERARKGDNLLMIAAMAGLKDLFAQQQPLVKSLRTLGLKATEKHTALKTRFIKQAMGIV